MKKLISISLLFLGLVSCSNAVQTSATLDPTAMGLTSTIPTQTLEALPRATATLESVNSPMPEQNALDPQGAPVEEWRGIPIMPEAIAGQEAGSAYSFRANVTPQQVQDFYREQLMALGWSQQGDAVFDANGGQMTFRQEGAGLTITVTPADDSLVILLTLILA